MLVIYVGLWLCLVVLMVGLGIATGGYIGGFVIAALILAQTVRQLRGV